MVQPPPTRIQAPWGSVCLSGVGPEVCGCVAPVLTCVGSRTWGKKKVLHCELLCPSFFVRLSGKVAWQHQHVAPLLQQHPCVLTLWLQVSACGCQLMNYSVKILKRPRGVIVRGNSEVSLVSLTLFDVITPDRNQHKVKKETCVPLSADITKTIKLLLFQENGKTLVWYYVAQSLHTWTWVNSQSQGFTLCSYNSFNFRNVFMWPFFHRIVRSDTGVG